MNTVLQTLLNILAVEPAHPHNGTWANVEGMLASGWEERPNSDRFNDAMRFYGSFSMILLVVRMLY